MKSHEVRNVRRRGDPAMETEEKFSLDDAKTKTEKPRHKICSKKKVTTLQVIGRQVCHAAVVFPPYS